MKQLLLIALTLGLASGPALSSAQEPPEPGEGDIEDDLPPDLAGDDGGEPGGTPEVPDEEGEVEEEPAIPPAVDPAEAMKRTPAAQKSELSKTAYEFCNDDDFKAQPMLGDRHFCRTWDESVTPRCEHALKSCKIEEPWFPDLKLPPFVGWLLVGGLVIAILYLFARALMASGWGRRSDLDLGSVLDEAMAGDIQALPEAPAMVILKKARQTMEEGRIEEAAVLAQLAALRYFDDSGIVSFHPSRTNGEYLRALRRAPELAALYRAIAKETDRVRFGDGRTDRAAVEAMIATGIDLFSRTPPRSEGFEPAVGLFLAVILGSTLLSGCEGFAKPFYNHRPTGMSALAGILREIGLEVEITRVELTAIPEKTSVVVMRSSALGVLNKVEVEGLLDRDLAVVVLDDLGGQGARHFLPVSSTVTSSASVSAVLPVLGPISDERSEPQVLGPDSFCGVDLAAIDFELGPHVVKLPAAPRLAWDGTISTASASKHRLDLFPIIGLGPERASAVTAAAFGAARLTDDDDYLPGCIFVFATPDLFTNGSLALEANAKFTSAFFASLTRKDEKVLLIDYAAGKGRSAGMTRAVAEAKMLPLVIQGALFTLMLFLFMGAAFGPLRDPVRTEHKSFSEHIDALGRHYAATGQAGMAHAARALAKLLVMRHRHDLRGGKDAGWQLVARHLAEQHELDERDVGAALRLGLEGADSQTQIKDELAASDSMLRTLSVLLTGRARSQKKGGAQPPTEEPRR